MSVGHLPSEYRPLTAAILVHPCRVIHLIGVVMIIEGVAFEQ